MLAYTRLLLAQADERISEAGRRCAEATRNATVDSEYIDSSREALAHSRALLNRLRDGGA